MKEGVRIADDAIYLNENRLNQPKELFKQVANAMEPRAGESLDILDVGCATGEFIGYLRTRFPNHRYAGIDVSVPMVERATASFPFARFSVGSILDGASLGRRAFDVVLNSGVLSIFDEIELPLRNLVDATRAGGQVYVLAPFNDDPVDVIMRYRLAEGDPDLWQSGWNIHSKATVERVLRGLGRGLTWRWQAFELPFAMAKREDPMRSWTIGTEAKPFQRINGACQLLNAAILCIQVTED